MRMLADQRTAPGMFMIPRPTPSFYPSQLSRNPMTGAPCRPTPTSAVLKSDTVVVSNMVDRAEDSCQRESKAKHHHLEGTSDLAFIGIWMWKMQYCLSVRRYQVKRFERDRVFLEKR